MRFCSRVRPRLERDVALVRIDEWVLAARVQADVRHFESRGVGALVRHLIQTNLLKLWRRDRSLCQSSVSTLSSFLVNPRRGISACVWVGTGDVFVVASFPIRLVESLLLQPTNAQSSSAIYPNEWTGRLGQHPMSQAKQLNKRRGTGERERKHETRERKEEPRLARGIVVCPARGERNDRGSKGGNGGMCIPCSPNGRNTLQTGK